MSKTVLITGANRGIGLETARQLGKLGGYTVIIGSRNAAQGQEAVETLKKENISTLDSVEIDITSDESVQKAHAYISKKYPHLDVLINNTGVKFPYGEEGDPQVNLEYVREAMDINLIGTIRVTNQFLDMVKAAPEGRIVNLSSIMGSLTLKYKRGIAAFAYNASKAAINMYTVNLAESLKNTKVKVNSAHPGYVRTDMGGPGADLPVEEGAETSVYLATLPSDGPTGGYFFRQERLPW